MGEKLLKPEDVCLHVIDVQESLMAKIHRSELVAETVELLVRCSEIFSIPIIANTQYRKGLGPYLENIETLLPESRQIDKVEFNALGNEATLQFLNDLPPSRSTVVLVGVETHICIYQTAVGYLARGMDVWVVSDGVSSRKQEYHDTGLQLLAGKNVTVGPAEMLIYELLGRAGTPEFKQILPLIVARG